MKYSILPLLAVLILSTPRLTQAETTEEALISSLQKKVQELLSQVTVLQSRIEALEKESVIISPSTGAGASIPTPSSSLPLPQTSRVLTRGMKGDDVKTIQEFLAKDREIYPEGLITGFFGVLTEKAIQKFQLKYNIPTTTLNYGVFDVTTKNSFEKVIQQSATPHATIEKISANSSSTPIYPTTTTTIITPSSTASIPASTLVNSTTTIPVSIQDPENQNQAQYQNPNQTQTQTQTSIPYNIPIPTNPSASTSSTITTSTTSEPADTRPVPVLSSIQVTDITPTSVRITWITNETSYSQITYSETGSTSNFGKWDGNLVTNHSVQITGLKSNTEYTYTASSISALGKQGTGDSAVFKTLYAPVSLPISPIFSSIFQDPSGGSVVLAWQDKSSNETSFDFYRRAQGSTDWIFDYSYLPDRTSVSLSAPSIAGIYEYKILACNSAGCSADSNIKSITINKVNAPSNLTATVELNTMNVSLQWADNSNSETKFEIYRRLLNDGSFMYVGQVTSNITSFVHTAPYTGTHEYEVRACNSVTCSPFSNYASILVTQPISTSPSSSSLITPSSNLANVLSSLRTALELLLQRIH